MAALGSISEETPEEKDGLFYFDIILSIQEFMEWIFYRFRKRIWRDRA